MGDLHPTFLHFTSYSYAVGAKAISHTLPGMRFGDKPLYAGRSICILRSKRWHVFEHSHLKTSFVDYWLALGHGALG
jgi:hypothetical protein